MGARRELSKFHVIGSLGVAAIIGGLAGSWTVFALVAAVLIASSFYAGEIRGKGGKR
jgi:hypothetical protein